MRTAIFLPVIAAASLLFGAVAAEARGGGGFAHAGGFGAGYGRGGFGPGGTRFGYGNGAFVRFGSRNGFHGRIGIAGNRRGYYPDGGFGVPGYYPGGLAAPYAASAGSGPAPPTHFTTRSEIIRRGPAFGEPGYVSHPVIYRLVPGESRQPGTRRFKVERLDF